MDQKIIASGLVALVIGFALGNVTGNSGPDLKQIDQLISERLAPASEAIDGLGAQFADLGERIGGLDEKMAAAAADTSVLDDLGARIDTMAGDLQSSISAQSDAAAAGFAALGDKIGSAATTAAAAVTPAAASAAEPTAEMATGVDAGAATGLGVGQTAILADGAVRAFVSRISDGGARLSINGTLAALATGESAAAGDCQVTLDSVDGGKASVSATCAAPAGDTAAAPAAPAEPIEGATRPGETALLGDGAARVFVSGTSADASTARIAVNGLTLQTVSAGEAINVGEDGCTLTVDAIAPGQVALGYGCDS